MNTHSLLSEQDQPILNDALHYMNVEELRSSCMFLGLSETGKKSDLIQKIMHFVKHQTILEDKKIPAISCAQDRAPRQLSKDSLMLYGAYKNDHRTRSFFKALIGDHFHFTAFGIDWLSEQWLAGFPPTYQEFADYWGKEFNNRAREKPKPKQEWAYINFMIEATKADPTASKSALLTAWKKIRSEKAAWAYNKIMSLRKH